MPEQELDAPGYKIHPLLDPGVKARLVAYCREERRTISNAVNLLLDRHLPQGSDDTATMTEGDGPRDMEE